MPECLNCGSHLSHKFVRVMTDETCPECTPNGFSGIPVAEIERRRSETGGTGVIDVARL